MLAAAPDELSWMALQNSRNERRRGRIFVALCVEAPGSEAIDKGIYNPYNRRQSKDQPMAVLIHSKEER
jgi:hypothetical protein